MASELLGRVVCPVQCGYGAAHVKIKTDKAEGKSAYPYVHCPECGCALHTRSETQARALLAITRAEKTGQNAPQDAQTTEPAPDKAQGEKTAPGGILGGFFAPLGG